MALGTDPNKQRLFLNFKDGGIVHKNKDGEVRVYDFVEGRLRSITTPDRTYGAETVKVWNFELEDPETGEVYVLSTSYSSGIAKSLLLCMASPETLGTLRISSYLKDGYPRVKVEHSGERLDWKYKAEEFPPLETVSVAGKEIRTDTKRMEFFEKVAEEVRAKISAPHRPEQPRTSTPAPSRGPSTNRSRGFAHPEEPLPEVDYNAHRAGEPDGLPF